MAWLTAGRNRGETATSARSPEPGAGSREIGTLPEHLARVLEGRRAALGAFGQHARWLARAGSTNDEAARWALEGAPEGAWVVADEQTAGRGRRGREWTSPAGAGLYLSVVFRPTAATDVPVSNDPATMLLTLMAGVAAIDGIRRAAGVNVTLKWPNDVIVEASLTGQAPSGSRVPGAPRSWRKVAGILAEATSSGSVLQFVVVGIGVNVRSAVWPPEVAARAASLEAFTRRAIDRDSVLVELLTSLAEQRTALVNGGAPALLERWRAVAPSSQGHRVSWETPDGPRSGLTAGIDADGALLVVTPHRTERIVAGELSWE